MASVPAVGNNKFTSFWAASSQIDSKEATLFQRMRSIFTAFLLDAFYCLRFCFKYTVQREEGQFSVLVGSQKFAVTWFYYPIISPRNDPVVTPRVGSPKHVVLVA